MSELNQSSSELSLWQTEMLRLTAFPSPPIVLNKATWWNEVVGEEPETSNAQPRTGRLIEVGKYQDAQLGLIVQPNRIDWNYTISEEDPLSESVQNPTIGTFPDALKAFRELMHRWLSLQSSPSINRLALGAVLLQPVESIKHGYDLLTEKYLPFAINADRSSDFMYQINRQRDSQVGIPKLELNRLRNWSVSSRQNFMISIVQGQVIYPPKNCTKQSETI